MQMKFRDVNEAFRYLVEEFQEAIDEPLENEDGDAMFAIVPSRVGQCCQYLWPSVITFENPLNRVLMNQERDANPIFHLYESLWMLAGRNDIAPLAYYSSGYSAQVDDGDGIANGAYGFRWRHAKGDLENADNGIDTDQLKIIIDHFKQVPTSRRVVLQMWNVEDDLLKIGPENQSKDVCCNTAAYFLLRSVKGPNGIHDSSIGTYLDMTVTNRSNDLVWGMLGANVVHFSFLQEYLAACIGVEVGRYHQITNNLHVYTERFKPDEWINDQTPNLYEEGSPILTRIPLVAHQETFDRECKEIVENYSGKQLQYDKNYYREPFLDKVAAPMFQAFELYKRNDLEGALNCCKFIGATDWQFAATNWFLKRKELRAAKSNSKSS